MARKKDKYRPSAPDWMYPAFGLPNANEELTGIPISQAPTPGGWYGENVLPMLPETEVQAPFPQSPQQTPAPPGVSPFMGELQEGMQPTEFSTWLQNLVKQRGAVGGGLEAVDDTIRKLLAGPRYWGQIGRSPETPQAGQPQWPTQEQFDRATAPNLAFTPPPSGSLGQRIGTRADSGGGGAAAPGMAADESAYNEYDKSFSEMIKGLMQQKATMELAAKEAWQQYNQMSQQQAPQPGLGDVMREGFADMAGAISENPQYGRQAMVRTERGIEQQLAIQRQNAQNVLERYNQMFQQAIKAGDMAGAAVLQQNAAKYAWEQYKIDSERRKLEFDETVRHNKISEGIAATDASRRQDAFNLSLVKYKGRMTTDIDADVNAYLGSAAFQKENNLVPAINRASRIGMVVDRETGEIREETPDEWDDRILSYLDRNGNPIFLKQGDKMHDAVWGRRQKRGTK